MVPLQLHPTSIARTVKPPQCDQPNLPSHSPAPLPLPPVCLKNHSFPLHRILRSRAPCAENTFLHTVGHLNVTVLIVYSSAYLLDLSSSEPLGFESMWVLRYERSSHIWEVKILFPSGRQLRGEIHPGKNIAVIERRVTSVLGPMLGKGLICVDWRIRRDLACAFYATILSSSITLVLKGSHSRALMTCSCTDYSVVQVVLPANG